MQVHFVELATFLVRKARRKAHREKH